MGAMPAVAEVERHDHHTPHILLVEDQVNVGKGLQLVLNEAGYDAELATTGRRAIAEFEEEEFDLVVADLRLPDIDGMDVIRRVKIERPDVEVIAITGYPTVSGAVEAMKLGALEYLRKPFAEEEFTAAVNRALAHREQHAHEAPKEAQDPVLIQRREVFRVLERAAEEQDFLIRLLETGSAALEGYALSGPAKAAIASGDLTWLRRNVGELTQKQRYWIDRRLQVERW